MPKDATKNVDRYKIRGGQLNEFDFHQNQEEFADQKRPNAANFIPGTPPEVKAEGIRPVVAPARKPAKKRTNKAGKAAKATKSAKAAKTTKEKKSRALARRHCEEARGAKVREKEIEF